MSSQSKAILDLGKKLVDELELDNSVDTLGRWMAHYVAELIHNAESAAAEGDPSKQERCASAILELWRHRFDLPNGTRPFEDVEPILRALESLDPCEETPRYFRQPRAMAADAEGDTTTEKWLRIADGIDFTARQLIRYCLARASQSAADKTEEWVAAAEAAGFEDDMDVRALRVLIVESDLSAEDAPQEAERKQIEERLSRLEAFQELAATLAEELRSKLSR